MRLEIERPIEVGSADNMAKVPPPGHGLCLEWNVIDGPLRLTLDSQQCPHDRLNAFGAAGGCESRRSVEPVPVADRDRREAAFFRQLRDRLRIYRSLQHRITGEEA